MYIIECNMTDKMKIVELYPDPDNFTYNLAFNENSIIHKTGLTTIDFYQYALQNCNACIEEISDVPFLMFKDEESAQKLIDWIESMELYKEMLNNGGH